uniref:Acetylserotonin O-methyltransferase n=1 Tax=Sinocyclocheilus grahami TaxID=75366 RepID=A0A672PTA5_SINGR
MQIIYASNYQFSQVLFMPRTSVFILFILFTRFDLNLELEFIFHTDKMVNNLKDEVKIRFMDAMHSIARLTGKDVATAFDLSPYNMACDNGGCTGAMAYEFTKAHPGLSVIVFDLPQVIEVRRHFQPKENDDRVSFVGGRFFKDDLPKADLYILARILHDWSDEKLNVLLSKLSKMCTPGCGLLVSEIFLDEERKRPSRALLQALSMTEGKQRSTTEYRDLLEKHGVTPKHIKHTDNLKLFIS